ncbi:WD40-repeat-containing domain protein [Aspergillus egyptiacus]|nr:WD40-repeat-containing domain protein [Aspergillus egyptiacus]
MSPNASPARLSKRSRASDAALDMTQTKKEGVKRRRTSTIKDGFSERLEPANALEISTMSSGHDTQIALNMQDKAVAPPSDSWSLSRSIAGRFTNLDPILTPDEQYLFLALETAVHIYSVATSRLFRVLKIDSADSIIGYRISSRTQEHLYIFTSSGRVSEWDWPSNKQIAHWATHHRTISADLVHKESESNAKDAHNLLYSLRERKDGKRELAVVPLNSEEAHITVLLEANAKIGDFRIVGNGQAIVAYGGAHIFVGSASSSRNLELSNYTWREIKLASKITCIDIKQDGLSQQHRPHASEDKKVSEFDLALGGADGSILIYHDALAFLGVGVDSEEDKKPAPRRLHWHRDPVRAVRWSKDGNYVISGGHESVMVLWQLDTGRKQFLPHLSSPICNIVVSGSGNSYAVKLADNRTVVLSARELQPLATVTGLQFCARTPKVACQANLQSSSHTSRAIAAVLHPQHPDQLLVTVPATHQLTQEGITSLSAPILQTYDIRSNTHISRQALARTNATTLNIGPDGTQILTPDIKQLGVSQDGKWMATVDSWSPHPQDLEALDLGNSVLSELEEIYLKFWRWNDSSCIWELVTRIDRPHLSDKCSALVLDISPRPQSHEFATIGSDALLRLWRPVVRQRPGLKRNSSGQVPETWKCRNAINLKGYLEICNADSAGLSSASVCFSEDGSVLAVCLHSASTNPGVIVLIDVRSCSVRYNRAGVYSGDICAASFLGFQLVIVTQKSVFVWDTVNDIVRATDPPVSHSTGDSSSRLLAVNPRTHTFAVTSTKRASSKKSRKSGFMVQVYDIHSLSSRCHFKLSKEPVALLSNVNVAEYIIVDAGANIHQLGSANKSVQASYTNDLDEYPAFGLENLFGHQATRNNTTKTSTSAVSAGLITQPSERIGLAGVFGDTPSFVLPPSRIVFCDLVKALSA